MAPHPLVGISRNYIEQQYWPELLIREGYSFASDGSFINGTGDHILDPPTIRSLGIPISYNRMIMLVDFSKQEV